MPDGEEIVEVVHEVKFGWIDIRRLGKKSWWPVKIARLTPLIRAVVQPDGSVMERNLLGEEPRKTQNGIITPEWWRWAEAECNLRTWGSIVLASLSVSTATATERPASTVLGYEKDGRFVIVKVEEGR